MQPVNQKDGTTRYRGSASDKATLGKAFSMATLVAKSKPKAEKELFLKLAVLLNALHHELSGGEIPAYEQERELIESILPPGPQMMRMPSVGADGVSLGGQVEQAPGLKTTVPPPSPRLPEAAEEVM